MNYIYDILVNFNETLYDFYDWNSNDDIKHIRKIPIFRIKSTDFYDIKNNKVVFSNEFLDEIKNKTEIFKNRKTDNLKYSFLVSDGLEVLALNIEKKIMYSRLLIDEEVEILDICIRLDEVNIPYKIVETLYIDEFKTRKQISVEKSVRKELKKIINEKNIEKLKYIYYKSYNKKINSVDKIIIDFNKELSNEIITKINKILNLKINSSKNV